MARPRDTELSWRQLLLFNTAGGLVVPALIVWLGQNWTWPGILYSAVFSIVYAHAIGTTAQVIFQAAGPWLGRPSSAIARWSAILALLIVCAVVGTAIGSGVILLLPINMPIGFGTLFQSSIKFSLPLCMVIGISMTIIENVRDRLRTTSLELRTNELRRERAEKLAAEARLSSLEGRVHPHFLFNALNSISALIREDPQAAERLIERLAALLRFSLDSHTGSVPLHQELRVVADYLEIEKARFGDRLRYRIDVPDDVQSCELPAMSVQTLVENSVKYAIAPRREGGSVEVNARAVRGVLEIEVRDDGPGIPPTALTQGHGLDLVQSRLHVLHGDNASLHIDGSCVSLRLPVATGVAA